LISNENPKRQSFVRGKWFDGGRPSNGANWFLLWQELHCTNCWKLGTERRHEPVNFIQLNWYNQYEPGNCCEPGEPGKISLNSIYATRDAQSAPAPDPVPPKLLPGAATLSVIKPLPVKTLHAFQRLDAVRFEGMTVIRYDGLALRK
jgi:hypothetical protein